MSLVDHCVYRFAYSAQSPPLLLEWTVLGPQLQVFQSIKTKCRPLTSSPHHLATDKVQKVKGREYGIEKTTWGWLEHLRAVERSFAIHLARNTYAAVASGMGCTVDPSCHQRPLFQRDVKAIIELYRDQYKRQQKIAPPDTFDGLSEQEREIIITKTIEAMPDRLVDAAKYFDPMAKKIIEGTADVNRIEFNAKHMMVRDPPKVSRSPSAAGC
jgi:hypothetical protein